MQLFFPHIVPCNGGVHKRRRFKERERPEGEWGVEVQLKTKKKRQPKVGKGSNIANFEMTSFMEGPKRKFSSCQFIGQILMSH